ncbi:MAG: Zn-dependent alcohol dehydrogenase [Dehalococcoidales bacterium]|nr:Zn-dependent alcohol dehydrogenase [Dehalococcoidales bacterium]
MKAAICYEIGKPLVVEDVNIDPPKKGEVKVRLAATAICHSDISILGGEMGRNVPLVAGHECAGYVEEVGEGVTTVQPGDNTVISVLKSCGKCYYCMTGRPHLCEFDWPLNRESRLSNNKGQRLAQMIGGFSEYIVVDQSQAVKIPKEIPLDSASLLACGVIAGFNAVVNRARVEPLSSVVVIGTGGVGINSIQGAAYSGARPVIAVDISDTQLASARTFGATHTVNSKNEDPVKAVMELTMGRGADYVFVAVGSNAAIAQGVAMTGKRGTTVIIGMPSMKENMSLPAMAFMGGERVLMGSLMGSTRLQVDIPRLISLYQEKTLKLDELITKRYPLEKINEAIESLHQGNIIRNVIVF